MSNTIIEIGLAPPRDPLKTLKLSANDETGLQKVVPGVIVTRQADLMRGHGTYLEEKDGEKALRSSLLGVATCVNKLVTVTPRSSKYTSEVGDVVVGQVVEVSKKRWRVDIHAGQNATLQLSYVDLPSGEIRRQVDEDELWMKDYLKESDIICAQVYSTYNDGSLCLSVRGGNLGKLGQGVLVKVPPSLVKHNKIHFHNMTFGIFVVIGRNGYIWISPTSQYLADNDDQYLERQFSEEQHSKVARMRACILALAETNTTIFDMSMIYTYEASFRYKINSLQKPETIRDLVETARMMVEENGMK